MVPWHIDSQVERYPERSSRVYCSAPLLLFVCYSTSSRRWCFQFLSSPAMNPDPAYGGNVDSTGRLLILPGVFSGEEDFCEWIQHFESVAVINKWDDITKLQWLHVRVAGKAGVVLSRAKSASYKQAREALQECFEPSS